MIFVCEMNYFAESTPQWYSSASHTIAERAQAYNMPGVRVDGKDVVAVYAAAKEAIERARKGEGPSLIECVTYRNYGHFEGDEQKYKSHTGSELELEEKDPIKEFRKYVLEQGLLDEQTLDQIEAQSRKDVDDAIAFAEQSPIRILNLCTKMSWRNGQHEKRSVNHGKNDYIHEGDQ